MHQSSKKESISKSKKNEKNFPCAQRDFEIIMWKCGTGHGHGTFVYILDDGRTTDCLNISRSCRNGNDNATLLVLRTPYLVLVARGLCLVSLLIIAPFRAVSVEFPQSRTCGCGPLESSKNFIDQ